MHLGFILTMRNLNVVAFTGYALKATGFILTMRNLNKEFTKRKETLTWVLY